MEFRQRAPRDRLDQDGPLSEERPLPKVPCWVGETERERWVASVQSAFSRTSAGVVNCSHDHSASPCQGEARCLWASSLSTKGHLPEQRRWAPANSTAPSSQTPGLFFSPPCGQSTHGFPCYWISTSSVIFYSKCCSPHPQSTLTSTWSQHSTPTLTASNILLSLSLSSCQRPNSIPNPKVSILYFVPSLVPLTISYDLKFNSTHSH